MPRAWLPLVTKRAGMPARELEIPVARIITAVVVVVVVVVVLYWVEEEVN